MKLIYLPQNGKFTKHKQEKIKFYKIKALVDIRTEIQLNIFASRSRRLVASSLGFTQPAIRLAQLESFQLS